MGGGANVRECTHTVQNRSLAGEGEGVDAGEGEGVDGGEGSDGPAEGEGWICCRAWAMGIIVGAERAPINGRVCRPCQSSAPRLRPWQGGRLGPATRRPWVRL